MRNITTALLLVFSVSALCIVFQRCKEEEKITKEALGRLIFFDSSLSEPSGQSCATCHRPETAFTDTLGRAVSEGAVKGLFSKRNSMSICYTAYVPPLALIDDNGDSIYAGGLFWDGRVDSLAQQAAEPFLDKLEMGNDNEEAVVLKLIRTPYYQKFCEIYGEFPLSGEKRAENIRKIYAAALNALAAYQASAEVNKFSSRYDLYLEGKYTMTEAEAKGFELFKEKGKCAECHILDPDPVAGRVLFTDHTYDNLGLPKNPDNPFYGMEDIHNPDGRNYIDEGLKFTTGRETEQGLFRVPTLRNITETAPYGHNGYFKTLAEIVRFYNVRDVSNEFPPAECPSTVNKEELGNLGLTPEEEQYLVDFMGMLSDK